MQFYNLEEGDEILIGDRLLSYHRCINIEVNITRSQPNNVQTLVPETQDDDTIDGTEEELEDIEIAETPEESYNLKLEDENELMETQDMLDNPMDIQVEENAENNENLNLMTQPFFNLRPATRSITKQQKAIKPKTRSLTEFEATQAYFLNTSDFGLETQPFAMPNKTRSPLCDNSFNFASRAAPKKVNKILLDSSDSETSDNSETEDSQEKIKLEQERTTDEVSFKKEFSQTPPGSPPKNNTETPAVIPRLPTQVLMDSELLNRVNSSQNFSDESIEFKQENSSEEVSNTPLHVASSFKRIRSQLELKPKKKVKFMKYESDEEN